MNAGIEDVRAFWNANPCGNDLSAASERKAFFDEHEQKRYSLEPHIPKIARFDAFNGLKVLEIGCGIGCDGLQFGRAGADYTGVDLTPAAVATTSERFGVYGLSGRFEVVNAELLPFDDTSF